MALVRLVLLLAAAWGVTVFAATAAAAAVAELAPTSVVPLPGAVDRAEGWNARAFIQDDLWTQGRAQYAVWVDPAGMPVVGKRPRPGAAWETFDLGSIPGNPLRAPTRRDDHNVYAVGVDASGYLHVAGNMHGDRLRLVRSTQPGDVRSWRPERMVGQDEGAVTYPVFVRRLDGTLLFVYRDGGSGSGSIYLNELRPGADTWSRVAELIDGEASGESPYLTRVAVDRRGWIHLMVVWRGTTDPETNNDLSYARSRDGGRSWERADGSPLGLPFTHGTADLVLDTRPAGSGLANAGGLAVDGKGRPHAILRVVTGGRSWLLHAWRARGRWHTRRIPIPGSSATRAIAIASRSGRVAALLTVAVDATRARAFLVRLAGRPRWTPLFDLPAGWELSFDSQALRRGTLRLLVPIGDDAAAIVSYGPTLLTRALG